MVSFKWLRHPPCPSCSWQVCWVVSCCIVLKGAGILQIVGENLRKLRKVCYYIQKLGTLKRSINVCSIDNSILLNIFRKYRSGMCI